MKAVLQRVTQAELMINGKIYSSIQKGLVVLVGFSHQEELQTLEWMKKKILALRIFNDSDGKMNLSLQDVGGELLIVSQFTLYADSRKGNRPSYINAGRPEYSEAVYNEFIELVKKEVPTVKTGQFGADMKITLTNDGPVTILLEKESDDQ
jgi:D-tyrosyl-tRNA(Tyr) deacylase